jgi:S-adenosylmethionine synthetase
MKHYLTAESVCQGHPDKLCDFIADSILDAYLACDPSARVACEVMATKGKIIVAGEVTSSREINARSVVRTALQETGYDPKEFTINVFLHEQSPDIAGGVDTAWEVREDSTVAHEIGAGDQGTMYGYATCETPSYLPLPLEIAHRICRRLDESRKQGTIIGMGSDGKAQVTVAYHDAKPVWIAAIVVSVQHARGKDPEVLRKEIITKILYDACDIFPFNEHTQILINPSGQFIEGGPAADTGLTGRKIMVDTYGGLALHGGGAFSGKDPTKVDRSGAYMARLIAKHIVAAGCATRCEVGISYAIGKAEPVAVSVDTFSTGIVPDDTIAEAIYSIFPLRPGDIINGLYLRTPIYRQTSCYGHMGNAQFPWEPITPYYLEALTRSLKHHDH